MKDPAVGFIEESLASEGIQSGCREGRWRIEHFEFPLLDFYVSAIEADGSSSEYGFRAELSNFPATAPEVRLWDHERDCPPSADNRPKGGPRVVETFKAWGKGTVYRPWDRQTGPHNNNAVSKPHLAWRADRDLSFIFEDLHGLLNSNSRKNIIRPAA